MPNDPKVSEAAQKKADELNVDLNEVVPTGQEGQIVQRDVENHAKHSGAKEVTLHPSFGMGEYVDADGERYVAGQSMPVSDEQYKNLERDDEGNLAYPFADVEKGDE